MTLLVISMSCFICCSAVPSSYILKCVKCQYACCHDCISKWMRDTRATCPNPECNLPLSRELLTDIFPKLVPVLVEKQKSDLFDAEKVRMTGVLREVEAYRKYHEMKAEKDNLFKKRKELETELTKVKRTLLQINVCNEAWKNDDFERFVKVANGECDEYGRPVHDKKAQAQKDEVICPCPKSGCHGFAVPMPENKALGKCAVCDTCVCVACLCLVVEAHVCLPEDLASAEAIKKDSKPCPKCGTRISKVSGCDQMFCVACRTAFSWSTGQIENGPIHNPEYFRMRQRMREAGMPMREAEDEEQPADVPQAVCGQLFVFRFQQRGRIKTLLNTFTMKLGDVVDDCEAYVFALESMRFFLHLMHHDRIMEEPERKANTKYLVQFMVGELEEKQLQSKIMQREKHIQHRSELKAVHDIFFETGNNLLDFLFNHPEVSLVVLESFRSQMMNLFEMCNERLTKISKVYGTKKYTFKVESQKSEGKTWVVTMSYI